MHNYPQIITKSFKNAWTQKSIWLLSFVQVVCLFLVLGKLSPIWWGQPQKALWSLGLTFIFSLSSVLLWLKIKAFEEKLPIVLSIKLFFQIAIRIFAIMFLAIVLCVGLKTIHIHWTFFSLFSSLLSASMTVAMLAAVLFNLSFQKSLGFMLSLWDNKASFITSGAFVVILAHVYAFYLSHAYWPLASDMGGFSVSKLSATILVVFLLSAAVAAFFASLANAFLVILFLEVVQTKKDPEQIKNVVIQPMVN